MLRQGSIVRARVVDPCGGNPKVRPLLIVTPSHEISADGVLVTVAITGDFSEPLGEDEVALPYNVHGKAITGLTKPCVAKCFWQPRIRLDDVVDEKGYVLPHTLNKVLAVLLAMDP